MVKKHIAIPTLILLLLVAQAIADYKGFPDDQCTGYSAREFDKVAPSPGVNWRGNAGQWYDNASRAGWNVYNSGLMPPVTNCIAVWQNGAYGHVGMYRGPWIKNGSVVGVIIQEKNWPYGAGVKTAYLTWAQFKNRGSYTLRGVILPIRQR